MEEQTQLFSELPAHPERMALFDVSTGLRSAELCELRWHWEIQAPELNTLCVFATGDVTKKGEERIVVLNRIARSKTIRTSHKDSGPMPAQVAILWRIGYRSTGGQGIVMSLQSRRLPSIGERRATDKVAGC